jgi:hypothetical protein
MDSKYIVGFLIGFIGAAILHLISDASYQHTLQMIGDRRAVECIRGKFYRIVPAYDKAYMGFPRGDGVDGR